MHLAPYVPCLEKACYFELSQNIGNTTNIIIVNGCRSVRYEAARTRAIVVRMHRPTINTGFLEA